MQSIRRELIDKFLLSLNDRFSGVVLDIGGEAKNYRGKFSPPNDKSISWQIVNIDEDSGADIIASAYDIPLKKNYADIILITEVLEHLEKPEEALQEITRLLKPNGIMVATMPFMYQVHGDPYDFTRWTATALKNKITNAGMTVTNIEPMGGTWSVVYDTLRSQLYRSSKMNKFKFRIYHGVLKLLKPLFKFLDRSCIDTNDHITTGWAVLARKDEPSKKAT